MSDLDGQEREALTAHIAERLREARAGKNWSQDQLANECGWTQAAVSLYEAGHRRTGIYELCVLAEKLERPLAFFLDQLPRVAALAVRDEPPDQGTGKFGDPYMTSDGSDDPNRASAEAEGAESEGRHDACAGQGVEDGRPGTAAVGH